MVKNGAEIKDSDIRAAFWGGAAVAAPFAFMTAVSIQVHGHKSLAVWIVLGTMAGIVAVAAGRTSPEP